MGILSKGPFVYCVVLKGDRLPSDTEVWGAIKFFVSAGKLNEPLFDSRTRIVTFSIRNMTTDMVTGKFMKGIGEHLLNRYPDLGNFITVSEGGFESNGLEINIVGAGFPCGYIRIVHMKPMTSAAD